MDLKELWAQGREFLGIQPQPEPQTQEEMEREQEHRLRQDLQYSQEARRLLDDPLLQRFFTVTEELMINRWLATEPNDVEKREAAYRWLIHTREFKVYFEAFLLDEEYAKQQLAEIEESQR